MGQKERPDPPDWTPPSYASSVDDSDEEEAWKPPEYAQFAGEAEKKPSVFSRIKEAVLRPKPFNPSGIKPPVEQELPNPSGEERIKAANELVDPGQGDYFARHPERTPKESSLNRFLKGVADVPKSMYESVNEIGRKGAEQLRSGKLREAFGTVTSPLMSPIESGQEVIANKIRGEKTPVLDANAAKEEGVAQILGVTGLPGKEAIQAYKDGDYARLAGMGLTAAAVALAFHKMGGESAEPPIRQTGIPNKFRSEEVPYKRDKVPFLDKETLGTEEIPAENEKPLPIRSPNLDPNRFDIAGAEIPISKGKNTEDLTYDIARDKFNMGREIPLEEIKNSGPISDEPPVKQPFVNPFEKNAAKIALGDIPDPKGQYYWDTEGFGPPGNEKGMWMEKDASNSDVMSPKQRPEMGPWKPPSYAQSTDITEGFGGSGHPESPEYVGKVLSKAGKGKPGLSIEPVKSNGNTADLNAQHVVYRGADGEPISVAKVVEDSQGKRMVMDLATDKTKGLAAGRATKAVGDKLIELKATSAAGTMSPDAENFLNRMKRRTPDDVLKKAEGEAWKPPDYAKPHEEEPSFARSEQGGVKIGQNIKRSAQELTTGYSNPLEGIMVREGMQNAIDAIRHLDENGKISAKIDPKGIHISDNGKGMSREELETVFSNLHESGKTTETGATGGKGIGKATYILGGNKFKAETITFENGKKIKRTIEGTPDEFSEHVPIKEEVVPLGTPTGTTIHTEFKEGQEDWRAGDMLDKIKQYSRGIKSKIASDKYGREEEKGFLNDTHDKIIGKRQIEGHDVTIRVPKDESLSSKGSVRVHYSNNGMYQFSKYHYLNETTDHMPSNIIVDIHPNAEEGTREYPFPTQRESIKDDMQEKVTKMIDENLVFLEQQAKKSKFKELYASMSNKFPSAKTVRKSVMYDPGNRLTPGELETFNQSPILSSFTEIMDRAIDNMIKTTNEPDWGNRLEGVGVVLDPNMHGVHIPNPETGKSTILINPFIHIHNKTPGEAALENVITALHETGHIGSDPGEFREVTSEELKDPRIGRYLQSYLQQVMTHGGLDQGHGVDFIKRLGQIYGDYGPRRTFEETDNLTKLLTDDTGGYNSEVQRLLQIYQKSRGREATTEDLLSGTGDKSKSTKGGEGNVPPGDQSDGEGVAAAVEKLKEAIKANRGLMEEQEQINRTERARRFSEFSSVKQGGAAGAAKSLGKLKGEFDKVDPAENPTIGKKDTDTLFTAIKRSTILSAPEKARGFVALFKILNGEGVPVRSELAVLDDVFGHGFGNDIINMHGGLGAAGIKLAKTANTMKTMQSMFDVSAPLRQGAGLMYRREYGPAFKEMFKYLKNKEYYEASMDAMSQDPYYQLGREGDLFLAKPGSFAHAEEAFLNSYVGDLPKLTGIPMVAEGSERAYVGFLNKLRFDTFKAMVKQAQELGHESHTIEGEGENAQIIPSESTRKIAKYINNATGRGDLGRLGKITQELNVALWSPRMISSRINMLINPKIYMDLPPGMRREGIKSLLGMASFSLMVSGLAIAAGGKVGTNILSSDFMKSRFGNKVADPNAGLQQYVVAAARFLVGKTDSKQPVSRLQTAGRLLANKEAPIVSLAHTLAAAQKFTGGGNFTDQYGNKTSVQLQIGKQFVPMFLQDVNDLATSDADWSEDIGLKVAMGAASALGMGVQNYPEKKTGLLSLRKPKIQGLKIQ